MQFVHKPEIMGRLIKVKFNNDKLFLGNEMKLEILKSILNGVVSGDIYNSKEKKIGEWRTNLFLN